MREGRIRTLFRQGRRSWQSLGNVFVNRFHPPVVVLLYHRVVNLPADPQLLAVSPENFHAQMAFLKKNFPILRFEDDWTDCRRPSLVLTFDDGYADNYEQALPILADFGIPATFFVSSGWLDSPQEFWWDELERLILLSPVREPYDFDSESFSNRTSFERQAFYQAMHPRLKQLDAPLRERRLQSLREWAASENGRTTHRALNRAQLRLLAAHPLATIGAHTVSHTSLAIQSLERQREEIRQSKQELETSLNRPIRLFSYPFGGGRDFSDQTVRLLREEGFLKAAANFPGQCHPWTQSFSIPRFLVRDWNAARFEKELGRFWTR